MAKGDAIFLVDLKKTAFFHSFDNEVAKYGYHGQLALYQDGLETLTPGHVEPVIIACQDCAPFDVAVFRLGEAIEHGRKLYRRLLSEFINCKKTDRWPGICPVGCLPVVLPRWAEEREDSL
jgi:hypothetical protein